MSGSLLDAFTRLWAASGPRTWSPTLPKKKNGVRFELYAFPCRLYSAGRLPKITIGVGAHRLVWSPKAYVVVVADGNRLCTSGIAGIPDDVAGTVPAFILGSSFMREYYVLFDHGGSNGGPQVGFAKSVKG